MTHKILAIDPETRELGVAVFHDDELHYYGVKTIRDCSTPQEVLEKASHFMNRLLLKYQPTILAIEKIDRAHQQSALLEVLIEQIKVLAQMRGLTIYEYEPRFIRQRVCQKAKATKREVAERIAVRYQAYRSLTSYLKPTKRWATFYYEKIFNAIAVGLTCYQERFQTNNHNEQSITNNQGLS